MCQTVETDCMYFDLLKVHLDLLASHGKVHQKSINLQLLVLQAKLQY